MRAWQIKHICSGNSILVDLINAPHQEQMTLYADGFTLLSF